VVAASGVDMSSVAVAYTWKRRQIAFIEIGKEDLCAAPPSGS
jgi:predicted neuraminidase